MIAEAEVVEDCLRDQEARPSVDLSAHVGDVPGYFSLVFGVAAGVAGGTEDEGDVAHPQEPDRLVGVREPAGRRREDAGFAIGVAAEDEGVRDAALKEGVGIVQEVVADTLGTRDVRDDRQPGLVMQAHGRFDGRLTARPTDVGHGQAVRPATSPSDELEEVCPAILVNGRRDFEADGRLQVTTHVAETREAELKLHCNQHSLSCGSPQRKTLSGEG